VLLGTTEAVWQDSCNCDGITECYGMAGVMDIPAIAKPVTEMPSASVGIKDL